MPEIDLHTGKTESEFKERVRDILQMSPFDRNDAIYAELRRLKALEATCTSPS